jgi:hypothetical protein
MAINWAQVLQLASLLAATHSSGRYFVDSLVLSQLRTAGYGLCSDRVAVHNALLLSDRDTITRQWFRAWDFGRKYGPFMVTGSGMGFLGAALLGKLSIKNLPASLKTIITFPRRHEQPYFRP